MPDPKRRRIAKNENLEVIKFGIRIDAVCEYCGGPAGWDTFRTYRNRVEYNLSGNCQLCQDSISVDPGKIPSNLLKKPRKGAGFKSGGWKRVL